MKSFRLLSLCLLGSAMTLSACTKAADPMSTTTVAQDTADDPTETSGNTDFADDEGEGGDGDGDGDADGDADGDTGSFVPDNEDIIGVASCDPWSQDCPEDEKCVAYASMGGTWDANRCVAITGSGQPGDPCTYSGAADSIDDCGAESWCWDVSAEGVGTCTPFCTGSPDSPICGPESSCSIANSGSINLCLTSCSPLLQDCAVEGTSCFFDGGAFVCANATSDIPAGEPCGFINDCVGGTICLAPESFPSCNGASCCGEFCDLTEEPPTCTIEGTECTAFFEEGTAPPGSEDVGVCVVPA